MSRIFKFDTSCFLGYKNHHVTIQQSVPSVSDKNVLRHDLQTFHARVKRVEPFLSYDRFCVGYVHA